MKCFKATDGHRRTIASLALLPFLFNTSVVAKTRKTSNPSVGSKISKEESYKNFFCIYSVTFFT